VSDVQQIEAAIGQCDGVTCPAPLRHAVSQFFASENLVCDRFFLATSGSSVEERSTAVQCRIKRLNSDSSTAEIPTEPSITG